MNIKIFLFFIFSSHFSLASSSCDYFSDNEYLDFAGMSINYSNVMESIMEQKGYNRSFKDYRAHYFFDVTAEQINKKYFNWAQTTVELRNEKQEVIYTKSYQKRCWTQNCSITDMGKSLKKTFTLFSNDLSPCKY